LTDFGKVVTAMVTPFDADLEVDLDRAGELVERLIDDGTDSILVGGTTGESPTLSVQEKVTLIATVVRAAAGRVPVIAGTGSYSTSESVELTREAARLGVDGIMLVVPYYNKPPQEGLYRHFRTVAESTSLPVMIYNVPSRTSRNLEPDTLLRLAELPNVAAVKEASGDLGQISEICRRAPEGFRVYSGNDSDTLPVLSVGGYGVVSVASHLVARDIRRMIALYEEGDVRGATGVHDRLKPLFDALFVTTNPIPVKRALALAGFDAGGVRPPLVGPNEREEAILLEAMRPLGLAS